MKRTPALLVGALVASHSFAFAPTYDSKMFAEMRWRSIGPLRAGRTKSAQGIPSQPNVFYIGVCNGGVWKTTDYGRTWNPIFDDQPTGSIGSLAVAPSNPNIIYAGSGEGLQRPDLSTGDGLYKSTDAGKTWTHLGLRDGQQIPQIAVDPRNPDKLFVAVLGHPYGPNAERGLYRSTDGGQSFTKVLGKDENTGASDVQIDPRNPDTVYAALWEARQGPWENSSWNGPGGGIFKSTDGGSTWRPLTNGIPSGADGFIQANIAISPSNTSRLYASLATSSGNGTYRSDDAGEHWARATTDLRPAGRIGGGDLAVPTVDPKDPDTVYVASTVTWKSTDGGKTWTGFRGAPGGDDYQRIWINPNNPDIILIVSDQGAIITVNRGETWSSWYNQSTAQMYHVNADNDFPYRVCSGQQESGSACISSRGNYGQLTFREWTARRRRRVRIRRPRSARSQYRLRRQGDALRPPHRPGRKRRPQAHPRPQLPHSPHRARSLLAGRSARHVLRRQHRLPHRRWRPQLEGNLARPDAQNLGDPRQRRQVSRAAHRPALAEAAWSTPSRPRPPTSIASGPAPTMA